MVEKTIWLWFSWDCFIALRGFFIIDRLDSWKRQLTAGRDSRVIFTALKTRTKLVVVKHNAILVQIYIVRHKEESTELQDVHHRVFINRHSPLTMFRKVEGCRFGFQLPCKGTCSKYIHSNLQETDFELSVARLNSRTHSRTYDFFAHREWLLFHLANHRNISFSLDAFFGLSFVC